MSMEAVERVRRGIYSVEGAVVRDAATALTEIENELRRLRERETFLAAELDIESEKREAAEARVAQLEEALREITREAPLLGSDGRMTTAPLNGYEAREVARRALAHPEGEA